MSSPEGKKSKLPPADKAQRRAGQSLEEEIRGLFTTGIVAQSTTVLLAFGMAAAAWVNWARKNIYAPIVFTIIGVAAAAWACRKISRTLSTRRKLKRERDGKRLVGKILNRLQQRGYWVFHDAAGTPANIDHVVIGPGGVFTVCTKKWCKPSPYAKAQGGGALLDQRGAAACCRRRSQESCGSIGRTESHQSLGIDREGPCAIRSVAAEF